MKNLKQTLITGLLIFSCSSAFSQGGTGAIKGQILSTDNEPVFGATIKITQGGVLIGGTFTDEKGGYSYKPLNPGSYELIVSSMETRTKRLSNVEVDAEKTSYVDLKVSTNDLGEVLIEEVYEKPLVDKSYMTMKSINAGDFSHMAIDRGNIVSAILAVASDVSEDAEGELHVRGSRGDATAYIVDGVKSPNITGVAALSVEHVSVITGGIPAQYGDNTSGVIVVTTKDYFSGIRTKHMRENQIYEKQARIKRENNARAEEIRRKKEIEEELRLEKELNK